MASIKKYKTAKGTAWRVQYRSPDGKNRTKQGFKTKDAASAWADRNAVAARDGQWVDPTRAGKLVSEFEPTFFATKAHLSPTSLHVMESSWKNWVAPQWGARKVGSIQKSEVQAWLSANADHAVSARRAHGILAGILDLAVEDGAVLTNRARGIILPTKPAPKHVYLTAEQLKALVAECSKHEGLIMLLGTSGLRWGEATGLQAGDIPDVGNRLSVSRAVKWAGKQMHVGVLKGRENRVVSVTADVMAYLRELAKGKPSEAWLFTEPNGEPLRLLGHGSWFHCAVDRLVDRGVIPERITPHGLRHVAAGLMISHGANVKVVQRQLGHKDASVTLNTYAALFDSDLDQIGVLLQETFSNVVGLPA